MGLVNFSKNDKILKKTVFIFVMNFHRRNRANVDIRRDYKYCHSNSMGGLAFHLPLL